MSLTRLLPHYRGRRLDAVVRSPAQIVLELSPTCCRAACPTCGHRSTLLHSPYQRTLADLPLGGQPVLLRVRVRCFRFSQRRCPRQTFAERLPAPTAVRVRRTHARRSASMAIGFAVGGAPGARIAGPIGVPTGLTSVLRFVRTLPLPEPAALRLLGIDDWALRRGQRFGSILGRVSNLPMRTHATHNIVAAGLWSRADDSLQQATRNPVLRGEPEREPAGQRPGY
jgi:hypothetical protein